MLQRLPSAPAIPTCHELCQQGFEVAAVLGLQAPSGTPAAIIARLQTEVAATMREPAMATRMQQLGMVMEENGTANYSAFMRRDVALYAEVVKKLGLQEAK
jgi:tripartite-type tricarboxylate transporter receptor subunit TctC